MTVKALPAGGREYCHAAITASTRQNRLFASCFSGERISLEHQWLCSERNRCPLISHVRIAKPRPAVLPDTPSELLTEILRPLASGAAC